MTTFDHPIPHRHDYLVAANGWCHECLERPASPVSATAFIRGHECRWDGERWRRITDNVPAPSWGGEEWPCPECGLTAEDGGPDPCLGWLPDCESACCGHGTHDGWISRPAANVRLTVRAELMTKGGTQ